MCKVLPDCLNQIIFEARFTVTDLAEAAGVSPSMIYKIVNEEKDLSFDKAQRLSQYLSRCGDNRIAELMITPEYAVMPRERGTADGEIRDQVTEAVSRLAEAIDAHQIRDKVQLSNAIAGLRDVLADLEAERDRL